MGGSRAGVLEVSWCCLGGVFISHLIFWVYIPTIKKRREEEGRDVRHLDTSDTCFEKERIKKTKTKKRRAA